MANGAIQFILRWLVSGLAVLATAQIVTGFQVQGFASACWAALAIGFANAVIWPILFFLTLPINFLTLGLFTFVVNGAVIKICGAFIPGFNVTSWFAAIVGSIVLSIVSLALHAILV